MSWLYTIVFAGLVLSSHGSDAPNAVSPAVEQCPAVLEQSVDETEKFERSYPLNANGRVNVANVNGSITVEAWDRSEVKFEYTKIADTRERLADVEVEIESRADLFRAETNYDKVRTRNEEQWRQYGRLSVEIKLWVPRGAVLDEIETVNGSVKISNFTNVIKASAVNGPVTAVNLRGKTKLSTVNGPVAVDFASLDSSSTIDLETVNGTVTLMLPSDANATLKAETLNGSISNEFGLPIRKGKYVGRDMHGRVGSGDVQVKLESVNGRLSVTRKNDGKQPNPATNLLPPKDSDEEWDVSVNSAKTPVKANVAKVNKEIAKAVKEATKVNAAVSALAVEEARVELEKLRPELQRMHAEALKVTVAENLRNIDLAPLGNFEGLAADFAFFPSVPRIEKKSNSFPVKGTPKVTIAGRGCSVTVKGWDKPEVQYRVVQFATARDRQPLVVKDESSDSSVKIEVTDPTAAASSGRYFDDSRAVRIEVFVPRKSDLKIEASGAIRLEGVTGDLQIVGGDANVDVRDSNGKLNITNKDGIVRVVGFNGALTAKTDAGEIRLDGDFDSISGSATDGKFVLFVPDDVDADIMGSGTANFSFQIEDLESGKQVSNNNWRFGSGAKKFKFTTREGSVIVQNRDIIVSEK